MRCVKKLQKDLASRRPGVTKGEAINGYLGNQAAIYSGRRMVIYDESRNKSTPNALHLNGTSQQGVPFVLSMWCANKSVLDSTDPAAAFMGCRWHELFDEFTPDTFHPKLFSLSSLVIEAVEIGNLHADHDAWAKHLRHVQAEIAERLDRGFERTLCAPRHISMMRKLCTSDTPSEVRGIGRVLELEGLPDSLERDAVEYLRRIDPKTLASKKSTMDSLLTTLATHAFRKGHTAADCSGVSERIALGPESVRGWIASSIPSAKSEFDCVVAVEAPNHSDHTAIRKVCDSAGVIQASPKLPGLPDLKGVIFLRRKAAGFRAEDAVDSLKSDVRANLNLLALYNQRLAPQIVPGAWVLKDGKVSEVADRTPSFLNLHPRKRAVELANKAASALAGSKSEPAIRAALDLHNVAVSMKDHGLRLVNLWSALECLASAVHGDSIISRVERLVVPIITWRKIDKVVRYLSISIHRWLKDNPEIDRNNLPFPLGPVESVAPERILTLLCLPKDSAGIRSLLNVVSGHPLLLYRINSAWQSFHDPKSLRRDLQSSETRLGWHLWRIYRARNLLVHQGTEPACLPQLANHLQQYLSWTLSRILHGMAFGEAWTAMDSWLFWKSKAEHVLNSLEKQPDALTVGDMFPEELREPGFPVWPPASATSALGDS